MNVFFRLTKVDPIKGIVTGTAALEEPDKTGEIFDYESSKPLFQAWSQSIEKATDGKSLGNVRAMHSNIAAGKLTAIDFDDARKSIEVTAKIVDANEKMKLAEGVYTGFSIGGKYTKKWADGELTRYTAKPSEISIVDNPCIPSATFAVVKEDGSTELRKFAAVAATPDQETHMTTKTAAQPQAEATESAAPAPETQTTEAVAKVDGAAPTTEPVASPAAETVAKADASPKLQQVWQAKDGKTFAKKADAEAHNEWLEKASAATASPTGQLAAAVAELTGAVEQREAAAKAAPVPADAEKREFSDDQRDKMADEGKAMADGSYPIANKDDLKNAIQSFGRAKNKKAVKAHIMARAKALGAEDMLPDSWKPGADKAVRFEDLRKGLYDIGRLACIIEELEWLQQCWEFEEAGEQDAASTTPDSLKQNIAQLCATLRARVEEETNELLDDEEMLDYGELLEMSERTSGVNALTKALGDKSPKALAKVGAKHSKSDQQNLNDAHDSIAKMGIGCGAEKAGARHSKATKALLDQAHKCMKDAGAACAMKEDSGEMTEDYKAAPADMQKALDDEKARSASLEKAVTETTALVKGLVDRIKKLEDKPVPRPIERGHSVVSKTDDSGAPHTEDERLEKLAQIVKGNPEALPELLVTLARMTPRAISR